MSKQRKIEQAPATHTPGPWVASDIDLRGVYADGGGVLVASCHRSLSDANLIAAAPELLEIAQAVVAGGMSYPRHLSEKAFAAVSKAKVGAA